jgi:uncharacterized protein
MQIVKITTYALAIETFVPMLRSLSNILDKAAEHARAKKSDPALLVNSRLVPDMYTLAQQVQLACDHAKDSTARLLGREPTKVENDEKTLDELKARIAKTIEQLQHTNEAALAEAENREIRLPIPGMSAEFEMNGFQYLRDWALPHFYFHLVTAYDILRHCGVDIGKRDYMSHVGGYIRERSKRA